MGNSRLNRVAYGRQLRTRVVIDIRSDKKAHSP
jgi:hypothetical protein